MRLERTRPLESLSLVLTNRCNLACGYCYQSRRGQPDMDERTALRAIDVLCATGTDRIELSFYGGEPTIAWPRIERAVPYAKRRAAEHGKKIRFSMSTNGLLLDAERLRFLARHKFRLQLSFDGVPAAQHVRGAHTFDRLDRLLRDARRDHRKFFNKRLRVAVTWSSATLTHLADSIDYLLARRVRRITFGPLVTHDPGWHPEMIDELDRQFARIDRAMRALRERTGRVPLEMYRQKITIESRDAAGGRPDDPAHKPICGAGSGRARTVDLDGRVWGCEMFAGSHRPGERPFLAGQFGSFDFGRIDDAPSRTGAARSAPAFRGLAGKRSSYARCADCRFLASCEICPASIAHGPAADPDRVPDHQCAFQLVSLAYRERFPQDGALPVSLADRPRG